MDEFMKLVSLVRRPIDGGRALSSLPFTVSACKLTCAAPRHLAWRLRDYQQEVCNASWGSNVHNNSPSSCSRRLGRPSLAARFTSRAHCRMPHTHKVADVGRQVLEALNGEACQVGAGSDGIWPTKLRAVTTDIPVKTHLHHAMPRSDAVLQRTTWQCTLQQKKGHMTKL